MKTIKRDRIRRNKKKKRTKKKMRGGALRAEKEGETTSVSCDNPHCFEQYADIPGFLSVKEEGTDTDEEGYVEFKVSKDSQEVATFKCKTIKDFSGIFLIMGKAEAEAEAEEEAEGENSYKVTHSESVGATPISNIESAITTFYKKVNDTCPDKTMSEPQKAKIVANLVNSRGRYVATIEESSETWLSLENLSLEKRIAKLNDKDLLQQLNDNLLQIFKNRPRLLRFKGNSPETQAISSDLVRLDKAVEGEGKDSKYHLISSNNDDAISISEDKDNETLRIFSQTLGDLALLGCHKVEISEEGVKMMHAKYDIEIEGEGNPYHKGYSFTLDEGVLFEAGPLTEDSFDEIFKSVFRAELSQFKDEEDKVRTDTIKEFTGLVDKGTDKNNVEKAKSFLLGNYSMPKYEKHMVLATKLGTQEGARLDYCPKCRVKIEGLENVIEYLEKDPLDDICQEIENIVAAEEQSEPEEKEQKITGAVDPSTRPTLDPTTGAALETLRHVVNSQAQMLENTDKVKTIEGKLVKTKYALSNSRVKIEGLEGALQSKEINKSELLVGATNKLREFLEEERSNQIKAEGLFRELVSKNESLSEMNQDIKDLRRRMDENETLNQEKLEKKELKREELKKEAEKRDRFSQGKEKELRKLRRLSTREN